MSQGVIARIALPPLRERKEEIPALAAAFVMRFCRECRRAPLTLGDDFLAALDEGSEEPR